MSEIVEVPAEAFLALAESFLNANCRLYLIVKELATKKEIGCSGQYCTEILVVASPDDRHTEIALEKSGEGDCIEREYKCSKDHVTKVYWYYRPPRVFTATTRS